uniref:Uncharacterized protein n=1 Tax=Anguilla anguilla TaxID=7936 RepID=A0A0E9PF50_ANGAN
MLGFNIITINLSLYCPWEGLIGRGEGKYILCSMHVCTIIHPENTIRILFKQRDPYLSNSSSVLLRSDVRMYTEKCFNYNAVLCIFS